MRVDANAPASHIARMMSDRALSLDLATGGLAGNEQGNAQALGKFLAMRLTGVWRDQEHAGAQSGGSGSLFDR